MLPKPFHNTARAAAIAHALSHPIRVQILESLNEQGISVSELTEMLDRPQANISQHLAVLREVNLVEAEREGMSVQYRLNSPEVQQLVSSLHTLAAGIPDEGFVPRGRGRRRDSGGSGGRGGRGAGEGQRRKR